MSSHPLLQSCRSVLALVIVLGSTSACSDDMDSDDTRTDSRGAERNDAGKEARNDAGTPRDDAGANAQQVLTGTVDDSDVWLGAIVGGQRARLFFCGGPSSFATATSWLRIELDADGRFAFADDALDVRGQLDNDGLHGELRRSGEATSFSAQPVRASTLAGLYEAESDCGRIGLIVRPRTAGSTAPIAQGACVGPGHAPEQVNPILPVSLDEDGTIPVEVERENGSRDPARVQRATL